MSSSFETLQPTLQTRRYYCYCRPCYCGRVLRNAFLKLMGLVKFVLLCRASQRFEMMCASISTTRSGLTRRESFSLCGLYGRRRGRSLRQRICFVRADRDWECRQSQHETTTVLRRGREKDLLPSIMILVQMYVPYVCFGVCPRQRMCIRPMLVLRI